MLNKGFYIVVACDARNNGIGYIGTIPWNVPSDLRFFKTITTLSDEGKKNVVIMGRKTKESIRRRLDNRVNIVITSGDAREENGFIYVNSLDNALNYCDTIDNLGEIFVIGGGEVYKQALDHDKLEGIYMNRLHLSEMHEYDCFFPRLTDRFVCDSAVSAKDDNKDTMVEYCYFRRSKFLSGERAYLLALDEIIRNGIKRDDRTGTGTRSLFGLNFRYDLSNGQLPLFTTKKVFYKGILKELLWFISGSTDVNKLIDEGVYIWDGNTTREFLDNVGLRHLRERDAGAIYGFQMRHFGADYVSCDTDYHGKGFDQLEYVLNEIRTNPNSRRIIMNLWNPPDLKKGCLPPCHVLYQWFIDPEERTISCSLYQRSGDMGLGVPFNVASASLLTYMIGSLTGYEPKELIHTIGDAHVYENHIEGLKKQIKRTPMPFPKIKLATHVNEYTKLEDFKFDDFELVGYMSWPGIKMRMAV